MNPHSCNTLNVRLDNDSKFKAKFCKACKRRAGELDIDVDTPSDVKDFDVSSIEIFIELGLLTEAEFDAVSEGPTFTSNQ